MDSQSSRQGILLVALAAILWGTLGPTFRGLVATGTDPVSIGFWRALLAGLFLGLLLAWRQPARLRISRADLPLFVAYGLISVAIFFWIYPTAVTLSTVAIAAVLLYTAPAWVALLAALFLGEPFTRRKLGAIALAFVGTALVAGAYDLGRLEANIWGVLAGLGSGLTYALFSIFGKIALRRYQTETVMLYALGIGALFLLPFVGRNPGTLLAPLGSLQGIGLLLYVGLVPTVGSIWLYTTGLHRLNDAGRASIVATIEPLVAALLGYLLLGEALAPLQWVGGALILAGVALLAMRPTRSTRPAGPEGAGQPAPRG